MGSKPAVFALVGVALSLISIVQVARADLSKGSPLEVREGDTWTTVIILRAEKTRVLVKYDDGTLEWVPAKRLHPGDAAQLAKLPAPTPDPSDTAPGTPAATGNGAVAPSPAPANAPAPADTPPSAPRAASRTFTDGEAIEFKSWNKWMPGHIVQVSPHWILFTEDPPADAGAVPPEPKMHWTESWGVRVPGSVYDIDAWDGHTRDAQSGEIAPADFDRRQPAATGDQFAVPPADQRPIDPATLEKKFETVSFDNSHSPTNSGDTSLHLATTRPTVEFAAWALRGAKGDLSGVYASPGSLKVAVASFRGHDSTIVIRASLLAHGQLDTRTIHAADLTILAAGDEGDSLLSTHDSKKNLQYWKWSGKGYNLVTNLRIDESRDIKSAFLVGPDRAVVQENAVFQQGTVDLIDLQGKHVISSVKVAPNSQLYVHPSGQVVGVITSDGTALLLRSADFSTINEFEDAGNASNVTVDPTGQLAAYLTNSGTVRIVKIADKSQVGQVNVGTLFMGRIDLADDKFLLVDHTTAYDIKTGIPVWMYKSPQNASVAPLANGQFIIAAPAEHMAAVAIASIPDQVGRAAIKNAKPSSFILSPGTPIKIDCDFSPFGAEKEQASQNVTAAVQEAGMKISAGADEPFHLTMAIVAGATQSRDYAPGWFAGPFAKVTTINIPSNILTATLTYKGAAVWSQGIRFEVGAFIQPSKTQTAQEIANAAAQPNAASLKFLSLPSYLPLNAKPGSPAALGASDLQDRRFVPERVAKSQ